MLNETKGRILNIFQVTIMRQCDYLSSSTW